MPSSEITIAESLKTRGYATAAIGKWHLGFQPEHLPMKQGFDSYFGIPYSNDMDATFKFSTREQYIGFMKNPKREYWNVPLLRSQEFENKSARGLYGDVIEELDANVGRVLAALRQLKLDRNTLVVFTSDNGPWAVFDEQGGSAGLLRGAKLYAVRHKSL
ncbi:MAG: sulfatase-like hydrolase/transferase [Blastocatellia bacterium]